MEESALAERLAQAEEKIQLLQQEIEEKSHLLAVANQQVEKTRDDFENVINSMLSSLVVADARGMIQSANETTLDMLGYERAELLGQPLTVLGAPDNSIDLGAVADLTNAAPRNEAKYRTKTGDSIPVLFSSSGLYADNQLTGVVCVALDLSTYKLLESQLLQSEKMASIGQLAAGVAHEINNPMGFIYSNLGTLAEYMEDITSLINAYGALEGAVKGGDTAAANERLAAVVSEKERIDLSYLLNDIDDLVRESREGADRVRKIVLNLKEFSHVGREEKMHADINAGIESTLNIVWNELKYKATIDKQYGPIAQVSCFMQELNQVFMNLLVNAGHAIDEGGLIRIRTYEEEHHVCVEITDDGHGMPPEVQKRIFEPFFTTKKVGEGTGLGLSMAYQIVVEKHGGQLLVDSEPGQGTTFTIKIPKD